MTTDRIFKIKGQVKHYDWGGYTFIPDLLGIGNTAKEPFAEYWLGTHSSAGSVLLKNGREESLVDLIKKAPVSALGKNAVKNFSSLPFLYKILDVKEMLSIQVHPTREAAAEGFDQEERNNIPINAPHRNYKDRNHKPEMMVALSEFWLLHGFKPAAQLKETLNETPELKFLLPVFEAHGYKALYNTVMTMPQAEVNEILSPLVNGIPEDNSQDKSTPEFWTRKLYRDKNIADVDRGVFSIYFFNIVGVKPGYGVFQGAGLPHAYLEGQCVELMANSDNVLRGGLTTKHIDVPELMKHIKFEETIPAILEGETMDEYEKTYRSSVPDFELSELNIAAGKTVERRSTSAEIFIIIKGSATVPQANLTIKKGEAIYVMPETNYSIHAESDNLLYKAYIPENN